MLKIHQTEQPDYENSIEKLVSLKKDQLVEDFLSQKKSLKSDVSKSGLLSHIAKQKKASDFSSNQKVIIVFKLFVGGDNDKELCKKEMVSRKNIIQWKIELLEAFSKYSKLEVLLQALNANAKDIIIDKFGRDVYNFYEKYINISSMNNLVIPKNKVMSLYSDFNNVENVILFNKVNNFRLINKQFEEVNAKIPINGLLLGNFETFSARAERNPIGKIPIVSHLYFGFEFLFKRVFPKMPVLKKLYFFTTKGKNRLLSKAETLGRLISCGFDIVDVRVIEGMHYFVAKKVKEPIFDMNPSYGPLFKMKRVGKNGRIIGVYKLRTMHPYSEYLQDYILKHNGYSETGKPADDFRLVPWGKSLRRYFIDELPQLINVFKGELKLVGPRPVSQRYFQDIPEDLQKLRLTQKPGCIPPYVALDRKSAVDSVLQAEKEYLEEKIRNPYTTDIKYFFKAMYNIVFMHKRSA